MSNNNSGDYNSGDYNSGHHNSGYYNSGNNNSGCGNSGHYNSGNNNSGYGNSGRCNSGNHNSGWYNSGHYNSGNNNSGYGNSGHCNSGHYNSGLCNSGNQNSGLFNTDNPMIRCFNQETGIKREDFKFPNMLGFTLTEFKDGKLVTYDYKEAWKNFWNSISENRKSGFLNLPNFDSEIFEKITGIKIKLSKKQQLDNLILQIQYLKTTIQQQKEALDMLITLSQSEQFDEIKLEKL